MTGRGSLLCKQPIAVEQASSLHDTLAPRALGWTTAAETHPAVASRSTAQRLVCLAPKFSGTIPVLDRRVSVLRKSCQRACCSRPARQVCSQRAALPEATTSLVRLVHFKLRRLGPCALLSQSLNFRLHLHLHLLSTLLSPPTRPTVSLESCSPLSGAFCPVVALLTS